MTAMTRNPSMTAMAPRRPDIPYLLNLSLDKTRYSLIRNDAKLISIATFHFCVKRKELPLRSKKAGRYEKLLGFARSRSIVTRGSVSLSCATRPYPSCFFLNFLHIIKVSHKSLLTILKRNIIAIMSVKDSLRLSLLFPIKIRFNILSKDFLP